MTDGSEELKWAVLLGCLAISATVALGTDGTLLRYGPSLALVAYSAIVLIHDGEAGHAAAEGAVGVTDDRALSPAVAVVLVAAITLLLAAIIATVVVLG